MSSAINLEQRTATLPPLKAGEVLVKIHAVSLQYRDIMVAYGTYPGAIMQPQVVPCSDMAGEVIAVGRLRRHRVGWTVGDRVCANFATEHLHGDTTPATVQSALGGQTDGVLTQYKSFKPYMSSALLRSLVAIPAYLSYEEASTLPCAALTPYNALMAPRPVKSGDTVLILGTGGVSMFGFQLAAAAVIATSSSDAKLKQAATYGAKQLIDYSKTPEWEKEFSESLKGAIGGAGTLERSMLSVRYGGYVHIIGVLAQSSTDMLRLIKEHPEETRPVFDKVFPFAETIKAYEHLNSQAHVGKVVISLETI
ncbi:chaperonin 10-like protein [Mucidula mucida]|nr:chaperonin 10-like protein [Mucidula mucida]